MLVRVLTCELIRELARLVLRPQLRNLRLCRLQPLPAKRSVSDAVESFLRCGLRMVVQVGPSSTSRTNGIYLRAPVSEVLSDTTQSGPIVTGIL